MDFNFKPSQRLLVSLTNGDIFEGVYQNGSKNRVDLTDISEHPSGSKIYGLLSFYRNEIESIKILESEETNKDDRKQHSNRNNSKDVILLPKAEYERLKDLSRDYVYMATMDNRFFEAVKHLNNCETVGVAGVGSEMGRQRNISLLVMASWDQVYLFDILSYRLPSFHPKLKAILESDSIKKVVHDSRTLYDCLYHCHRVKLNNIFDTQVADLVLSKKQGTPLKKARDISESLQHYLNFPKSLLEKSLQIAAQKWITRPIKDSKKTYAALLGTYLITLKNLLEKELLKDYYAVVDEYAIYLKDMSLCDCAKNINCTVPDSINALLCKIRFKSKKHVCGFKLARHWLVGLLGAVVVVLIVVNFFWVHSPVYRLGNRLNAKQINPQQLYLLENDFVDSPQPPATNLHNENSSERCEVIHLGLVCSGYKTTLFLHVMLKSIFFYRHNPIHFHILSNKVSENVLKILFDTWAVPLVNVTFYNITETLADVRWVPNSHYSGIYGLLKLTFPKLIYTTKKIIVLDTDLTFNSDVYELWQYFKFFSYKQIVGIVENQSDFYLNNKKQKTRPWPALERGFNTGVMLYNLEKMRAINWDKLWNDVARRTTIVYGATRLGDQDIMNAVIKQNPNLVYKVPCQWNTQLSDHTISHKCYMSHEIKVVHWNSPKKQNVINQHGDYFRTIYRTFLELNGNLLKRQLFDCSGTPKNFTEQTVDVCSEFHRAQTSKWRTLLYFREFKHVATKDDVTFVAQTSFERLHMVEELSKFWDGPISITLYVTDPEFQECQKYIENSEILQDRYNIAYHIVFRDGEYYPINILRNVGLKNVVTPYVFPADIDFLPMQGLYQVLKNYLATINMKKKALIVPAFETQKYKSKIPRTKKELLEMWDNKDVHTFRYDVWASGHAPTNYKKWRTAKVPYNVEWEPDFEPYIVVRSDVTEYDIRFMGFGWNKVSHVMELEAQGYDFVVLPNAFVIHKPHAPSYDINKFRSSPVYRMCLQNLKEEFISDLVRKYGRTFNTKNNSVSSENAQ